MRKLDKRAISILVIAIFLISMIPIMPAQAGMGTIVVSGYPQITTYPLGVTLSKTGAGIAAYGGTSKSGLGAVHLQSIGDPSAGDEARIEIPAPSGFTVGDIDSISWYTYLVSGYLPHVDIILDKNGDTVKDEVLVAEGAYANGDITTGWATSTWIETWEGASGAYPGWSGMTGSVSDVTSVNDETAVWVNSLGPGSLSHTLSDFQTVTLVDGINEDTSVLGIEIEVDSWVLTSDAWVDDVYFNDVLYHFEDKGVDKGDTLTITGDGVTSGAPVNVYWDYVTTAGLSNNTVAKPDGTYEVEIDIPSDVVGEHFIWVRDVGTGETLMYPTAIFVLPKLTASPDSGLVGDEITLTGYGYSPENDVTITFEGETDPLTTSVETDEDGYFTYKFDVPTGIDYGDYDITAVDTEGWIGVDEYTVGASFTMTPDEGPTGTIISVEGRGWSEHGTVTFKIPGITLETLDGEDIVTGSDGKYEAELVIPGVSSTGEYTITATESNSTTPENEDSDKFEVDGLSKIKLSPGFGPPGETVTIKGYNFTQDSGTEVTLDFGTVLGLETYDTDSNGEFTGTFTAQALQSSPPDWEVLATDEFDLNDDAMFRLGMMIIIVSPTSGPSGDNVYLTGTGFEPKGDWNATLDGELIAEDTATGVGVIADYFYVPSMEAGTYNIEVLDIESEISLSLVFIVTDSTYVTVSPNQAPSNYNVTIEGFNYANTEGLVAFDLYNSTEEWPLEVLYEDSDVWTTSYGNFTGTFLVPDDASNGDYLINVTGSEDLFAQIAFSVVSARVNVAPRKATFDRGDTVSFTILNDFVLDFSYIEIYSPDETLWWITETFGDGTGDSTNVWILNDDDLYTVPNYLQTANLNQMELASDAPMGTWIYFFYDKTDDELMNGTFVVGPSTAAQVDEMLDDVRDDLAALSDDLAGITDDVEDDIATLSDEIANEMAGLSDDFADDIAGLANDIAQATDAGQSALDAVEDLAESMTDLGEAVSDIADIASDSAEASQSAADAANDAVQAANDAQGAAQGLTGLVYGAIGASLIAALAAIISLMQISKRIAG